MRTRSKVSSEIIEHAASDKKKKLAVKRKRPEDDSALGDAGYRSKRCKFQSMAPQVKSLPQQSMASQVKSPPNKKRHSFAAPEKAVEGLFASSSSKNGDDEVFAGAPHERGAASPNATGEKSSASLKKAIAKRHRKKESPVLLRPRKQGQSCDHTHSLDDHRGRDNEKSTEGVVIEQCSSRNKSLVKREGTKDSLLLHDNDAQHCEENVLTRQGGIDGQENLSSTHFGEGLPIVSTPPSPQEPAGVQCQSHEDGHHNEPDSTLLQGKTEKCSGSRLKKKGASTGGCLEESIQGEQSGSHTTLILSCPRSGKSKCRPGNIKQFNNQRKERVGSTPTQISQPPNSCYSRRHLDDAKSRWKNLAWSILSAKISPDFRDVGEQKRSIANSQNHKTPSLPKKRRKRIAAANALAADQRPVTGRMRQKVRRQQLSLLKRMKTWLTEAKFSQSAKEENSNDVGEEFIMRKDERHAFTQSMVESCQKDPNMRTVFLESVRMLTLSGIMHSAASNLLQQGPCEEVQNVMNSWADFKEQSAITKALPMNLLNAVNQLHEKRGDLSTKLSMPNVVGICTLHQIDEQTWKFQLPASPLENENVPSGTKSLGQMDTAV